MRNYFIALCLLVGICVSPVPGYAQEGAAASQKKPAAPAPRRDISGVWFGPVIPRKQPAPPMTASGQAFFNAAKPMTGPRAEPVATTNDPFLLCDPMGIPRAVVYETRGISFVHTPQRTIELFQYGRLWREIWTDGRSLPTNVGAQGANTSDPRYFGYSVGNWADDYTFVVRSTGFNENVWATEQGHGRSTNAMVEERYRRIDHDNLEVTVTVTDPAFYSKPYEIMKQVYTWDPKGEFEEQLCIPTEAIVYRDTFTPAGKQ